MPKATDNFGKLAPIEDCWVHIPTYGYIILNNLPDISDASGAAYNDEPIMGRAGTLKTYSHSETRAINITFHFFVIEPRDIARNLFHLRALRSATYPQKGTGNAPYAPPPICSIKCGSLLADFPLCAILKNCSAKFPTDVVWDAKTLVPYKFDVDTSWDIVFPSTNLPGQSRVLESGG